MAVVFDGKSENGCRVHTAAQEHADWNVPHELPPHGGAELSSKFSNCFALGDAGQGGLGHGGEVTGRWILSPFGHEVFAWAEFSDPLKEGPWGGNETEGKVEAQCLRIHCS